MTEENVTPEEVTTKEVAPEEAAPVGDQLNYDTLKDAVPAVEIASGLTADGTEKALSVYTNLISGGSECVVHVGTESVFRGHIKEAVRSFNSY